MISIVIPIYNESETIPELHRRLSEALGRISDLYEIIYVNDGSSDSSFEILKLCAEKDSTVKLLDLARNFGHQIAISAGVDYASGDAVILMDGDLQDPPELLPEIIGKWKGGFNVVYTVKKTRREAAIKRIAFHSFYKLMQKFLRYPSRWRLGIFL